MRKILIVGGVYDKHAYRFISHLKKEDNSLNIDILSYEQKEEQPDCITYCNDAFHLQESMRKFYKIKYLGLITRAIDFKRTLENLASQHKKYDAILILWINPQNIFAINSYKKLSNNIILVPLGSDVLRISKLTRFILRPFYQKADYIALPSAGFQQTVKQLFHIKDTQIVTLDFGSDQIDTILNSKISRLEAKQELGIAEKYVITIGYNAVKAQNHLLILKQLARVREQLPENLFLILPMTYPKSPELEEYIKYVKTYLNNTGFKYRIFEDYLDEEQLILLRKCSDIFIHAQTTDANCATIFEYLLSDCTILNGGWLHYPELEKDNMPYYTFNSIKDLGSCLIEAIKNPEQHKPSLRLISDMAQKGWNYQIRLWIAFLSHFND